jgi:hypothetical protein
MSMADDWERLNELEQTKGTLQYGQYLQIEPSPGDPDLVLVSKDLIRFVGEKTDINAFRVYLGPWQPSPAIVIDPNIDTTEYADPTPWAPPQPRTYDSMLSFPMYARVQWGSGGQQHQAFVDWPSRGKLIQVSGSYLQVNGFANVGSPNISIDQLPLLTATMAPEPGGGDSALPATFTYRMDGPQIFFDGFNLVTYQVFQVPPWARSFIPLLAYSDIVNAFAGPNTTGIDVYVVNRPVEPGFPVVQTTIEQQWSALYGQSGVTAGVWDPDFNREPFPLPGQGANTVIIVFNPGLLFNIGNVGCQFFLDL